MVLESDHSPQKLRPAVYCNYLLSDYVRSLELEVKEMKSKIRNLQADLSERRGFERPVAGPAKTDDAVMVEVGDNALIRSHIQSLNDMIGKIC
jgi:hypothetical protein